MALHKLVNGKRIDLSQEEEDQIKAEWAANEQRIRLKREEQQQKLEKKKALKSAIMEKMEMSEEDFDLLFNNRL